MINKHAELKIRDLTVTFSKWGQMVAAIDKLNLDIPYGEWIMLTGHNGSGKSTLLNAISGRISYYSGDIILNNRPIKKIAYSERAEYVFQVHQDPLLGTAPKLTIFENLMVADNDPEIKRSSKKSLLRKYNLLLEPLELSKRLRQLAGNLSGGERQLIALIIARLRKAPLLLLDEPLAALDPKKTELCLNLISNLHKEGTTILQVSHDQHLAANLGNRTIVMAHGKIVYDEKDNRRIDDRSLCPQRFITREVIHETN